MSSPASTQPAANVPFFTLEELVYVLNDSTRWRLLKMLAAEDAVMVRNAAKRLGLSATNVSKHLTVLRNMGVARHGLARLYHLEERFRTHVGQQEIDFGHCVVRFDQFT